MLAQSPARSPCLQLDNISGKRNRTWWCGPRLCDRAGASVPRMDESDLEGQWGPRLLGQEGRVSHHWFSLIVSRLYNFQDECWESKICTVPSYQSVRISSKWELPNLCHLLTKKFYKPKSFFLLHFVSSKGERREKWQQWHKGQKQPLLYLSNWWNLLSRREVYENGQILQNCALDFGTK